MLKTLTKEYIDYLVDYIKSNNEINEDWETTVYEERKFGLKLPYISSYISHHYPVPNDSFDRLFALYLIDKYPEVVAKVNKEKLVAALDKAAASSEFKIEDYLESVVGADLWELAGALPTELAYDNYEREGMALKTALINILHKASEGRDVVLKDSYANGGWFGAS